MFGSTVIPVLTAAPQVNGAAAEAGPALGSAQN